VVECAGRSAAHNISTQQGDVARLPFADASFDMVVTRFSAHHWNDVAGALAEACACCARTAPCWYRHRGAENGPVRQHLCRRWSLRDASHVRDYRSCEWGAKFDNAGFTHSLRSVWKLDDAVRRWVARMRTPSERVAAIRNSFDGAPEKLGAISRCRMIIRSASTRPCSRRQPVGAIKWGRTLVRP
jgi:SAM-dependent methyltransferase